MTRVLVVSVVLAVTGLLAGCPGDTGAPPASDGGRLDAPAPRADGAVDTGSSTDDTGGSTDDGGSTTTDGGGTTDDGGAPDDGGGTDVDGGTTDTDGGSAVVDGGGTDRDAGTTPVDGGPRSCTSNAECLIAGSYCARTDGNCTADGTCLRRPFVCPDVVDPVCGCDGVTYDNACEAHAAGQNVSTPGACAGGGTCDLRPTAGCCFDDGDCAGPGGGRTSRCVGERCASGAEGTCHGAAPAGECWEDSDCARGGTCMGERICPCGAACLLPDATGTCSTIAP